MLLILNSDKGKYVWGLCVFGVYNLMAANLGMWMKASIYSTMQSWVSEGVMNLVTTLNASET